MTGPVFEYLARDHDRLDALLERATQTPGRIDPEAFAQFRKGLLRHIGLEEKLLLPAAREANGGKPVPNADRLRADHSMIAALLVPTPTPEIVQRLRAVLGPHNVLEEEPGGVYETCERLVGDNAALAERLRDAPEVPVRPHFDGRTSVMLGGERIDRQRR